MMPSKVVMSCNEVTLDGSSSTGSRQSCGNTLDDFDKARDLKIQFDSPSKQPSIRSNCSVNQFNPLSFGYPPQPTGKRDTTVLDLMQKFSVANNFSRRPVKMCSLNSVIKRAIESQSIRGAD
jgi:hypothetical protein